MIGLPKSTLLTFQLRKPSIVTRPFYLKGGAWTVGGRGSDVNLTFIPFTLIFLISSVGFSANRTKCYYYTAHRRFNHSIVVALTQGYLLILQCLFLVGRLWLT